ncbi:hypothetical protein E4U03_12245, partial [Rothia nasimurium]
MTTRPTETSTSEITRRIVARLGENISIDQLYEQIIAELKEEYVADPDQQLHYTHTKAPNSPALCGEPAPSGGWFNPNARAKTQWLKLVGSICPICSH